MVGLVHRISLFFCDTGRVSCSHALLRQLQSLCSRLPLSADPMLFESLLREYSDAQLTALLAEITRGCSIISEVG